MNRYRVISSTVRFGRRVEITLGHVEGSTLEAAERAAGRMYPDGVEGWTNPRLVPVEAGTCPRPRADGAPGLEAPGCTLECLFTGTPCTVEAVTA